MPGVCTRMSRIRIRFLEFLGLLIVDYREQMEKTICVSLVHDFNLQMRSCRYHRERNFERIFSKSFGMVVEV